MRQALTAHALPRTSFPPRAGLAHLGRLVLRQAKAHSAGTGVPGMALLQGLHSLDLGGLVCISDEGV